MPQPLANREAVLEAVKSLVLQGVKTAAISDQTGVNPKTIRTWSRRYGWSDLAAKNHEMTGYGQDTITCDIYENSMPLNKKKISWSFSEDDAIILIDGKSFKPEGGDLIDGGGNRWEKIR